MSDLDLLHDYACANSQVAFATLVERHVNLVYAAAHRQVRSPHLAEEVTQSVFLDLARHAGRFPPTQPLTAWLFTVTRRTAIDVVRRESRRLARETAAAEIAAMKTPPPSATHLGDVLDEAMENLPESDRTALLLRFFESRSLREVGASLGISEDTAQKRVSRALDRLRDVLLRRGIAVSAAGLTADLSAHALVTAPVGLGATIATTVTSLGTVALHTATTAAAKTVAMTAFQKTLVTTVLTVGGISLFQVSVYVRQHAELTRLQIQSTTTSADVRAAQDAHAAATRRLAAVEQQIDARLARARQIAPATNPKLEGTIAAWLARASRLRAFVATRPDLSIPELRLLSHDQWAEIASKSDPTVDTGSDAAIKAALALARKTAEDLFAPQLQRAFNSYLRTSGGLLPDSLYQLLPHFESPISPTLLSRYHLLQTGRLDALPVLDQVNWLIETREIVDIDQDFIVSMGTSGRASHSAKAYPHARKVMRDIDP